MKKTRVVLAAVSALALVACSSRAPTSRPGTGTDRSSSGAAVRSLSTPAVSASVGPGGRVTADERDNGSSTSLPRGGELVVTLHSTYWVFAPIAASTVLLGSRPVITPLGGRVGRIPGSGAGLVRLTVHARAPGVARIVATRTSCGEAMRCAAGAGRFVLTVRVC